ncbi:glycoprotein-N-acetylgalactosamine 3-beta-galactosyltransferase 1-like [Lycorma delicatula]|uniref:glycoprotein-N-acetylgalactosamine 3-beta-galactosyltransferase 1-like n=1 Tax=Lycorma delicatula TaxID=130591 RepID=UPI003F51078F
MINVLQENNGLNVEVSNNYNNVKVSAIETSENVKVLCAVLTTPSNLNVKGKAVMDTWGKRCNKLLFMSSPENGTTINKNTSNMPVVELSVEEGHEMLWGKTKATFTYIYDNYLDDYQWFLKADDDTYIVMENLRYLLSNYIFSDLLYFGCKFSKFVENGFMSGGAGYILSRAAVESLIEDGFNNDENTGCKKDNEGSEDVEMGFCMESIGAEAIDTRDSFGRGRFFPLVPYDHLIPNRISEENWYWDHIYYPSPTGWNCCSDTAISFHYISPELMITMEYLIYILKPHNIQYQKSYCDIHCKTNNKL